MKTSGECLLEFNECTLSKRLMYMFNGRACEGYLCVSSFMLTSLFKVLQPCIERSLV